MGPLPDQTGPPRDLKVAASTFEEGGEGEGGEEELRVRALACEVRTTTLLFDTMYLLVGFRKSTPPQNRRLNILIS